MIFFNCLLLYSIFSISLRQEEQIHDFLHLLRIRSLIRQEVIISLCKINIIFEKYDPSIVPCETL